MDAMATNTPDDIGGQAADSGRNETRNQQRDRNWNDLLQELRVMQTGTQIIAGFLLTLPFQQRFAELDSFAVTLYLVLVSLAAVATCLMLVPVKDRLVTSGHQIVKIVLGMIGLLVMGTTALIFYVVVGGLESALAASVLGLGLVASLMVYPRLIRRGKRPS